MTCEELLDKGVRLEFHVALPTRKEPYLFRGQVVWSEPTAAELKKEYGVVFLDATPEKQAEIDELVEFLLKARGTA